MTTGLLLLETCGKTMKFSSGELRVTGATT